MAAGDYTVKLTVDSGGAIKNISMVGDAMEDLGAEAKDAGQGVDQFGKRLGVAGGSASEAAENIGKIPRATKKASKAAKDGGNAFASMSKHLGKLTIAAGAAFAAVGGIAAVSNEIDKLARISREARNLDFSAELLQGFTGLAEVVGRELDDVLDVVRDVRERAGEAATEAAAGNLANTFVIAFGRLGADIEQIKKFGNDTEAAVKLFFDKAIAAAQECGAGLQFTLQELSSSGFEKFGPAVVAAAAVGAGSLDELTEKFALLGVVADEQTLRAAEATQINFGLIGKFFDGLQTQVTAGLLPVLQALSKVFADQAIEVGVGSGAIKEMTQALTVGFLESLATASRSLADFFQLAADTSPGEALLSVFDSTYRALAEMSESWGVQVGIALTLGIMEAIPRLFDGLAGIIAKYTGTEKGGLFGDIADGVRDLGKDILDAGKNAPDAAAIINDAFSSIDFESASSGATRVADALQATADAARGAATAQDAHVQAYLEHSKATEGNTGALGGLTQKQIEYQAELKKSLTEQGRAIELVEAQVVALNDLSEEQSSAADAGEVLARVQGDVAAKQALAQGATEDQADSLRELTVQQYESNKALEESQQLLAGRDAIETDRERLAIYREQAAGRLSEVDAARELAQIDAGRLPELREQAGIHFDIKQEMDDQKQIILDQEASYIRLGETIKSAFSQVFDALIAGTLDLGDTFRSLGLAVGKQFWNSMLEDKFKNFDPKVKGNFLDLADFGTGAFGQVFSTAAGWIDSILDTNIAGSFGGGGSSGGGGGLSLGGIISLGGSGGLINLGGTGGGLNILGSGGGINLLGSGGGSIGNIGAGALGVLGLGAAGASQFIATGTTAAALGVPAGTPIITTATGIGASVGGSSLVGGGTVAGSSVPIAAGPATSGVSGISPVVSIVGSALGGAAGGITVYNLLAPGKTGLRGTAIQGIEGDILGNLNTAGLIGSGVGGAAAGVGAGIAAGAAAGSMAAPVIGTIAGALVGALFGVGTSQLSKGIDLQALETRKITGIDDLSTSAGIGAGLLTGFATAPGAFGYIQSGIMGDLLTGIPGLGLAIGPGGFRDFLFGLLGIPTVGTAMRRTTEGGLTSMGILERQGTQDRLLIDGMPNRLTEFDRENYRGRDFYSPEIGGLVRRLDRAGRLDDLLPGGRPVGLDNQGRSGSNLDDFGGDLLKMGRGLIGQGGTEQLRGLGLVIAEGIFGKDPDVSDRVLGHAKGLANIFTEMFASTLDEDSVGTGEMLETITRNARDYFETMGINAPAAFGLLQNVASDFFDEMEEGLVATGDKKWWEDPSGLDMLKSSASGLVQTFANDLPKGVELGSLVFDSLRVSGEKSMADISQSTQDAIATFSGGEGSGSFSDVFKKAVGNLEIPSGMGGKLFDTFSDEAKAKLDALSQDTELWAETLVGLLGSGFEIDLDHLFHRIADINASVMFLNEQLPSAIQQVSALGGDAQDVTNSVFENIKQQAYAAMKEIQSLNFQEAILGNEETGVEGITNDALEPVMNVLRRLTTTDEFDLSNATGVAEFNTHLNLALALAKDNLKDLQPEIQQILDAAEETSKIIDEAFAPSEVEAFFQKMAIGAEEANREFEAGLLGAIDAGKNAMRDALGDGASVWEAIQQGGDVFVNTMSANLRAQVFNAMTSAILEAAVFETTIGPAIEQLKVGVGVAMEDGVLSSDEVIWLSAFAENIISQGEMAVEALRPLFESLGLIQIQYEGGTLPPGPRPSLSEAEITGLKELEGITPAELRRERDRLFYEEVGGMSPEKQRELLELEGKITRGEVTISGNRVFGADGRLLNPGSSTQGDGDPDGSPGAGQIAQLVNPNIGSAIGAFILDGVEKFSPLVKESLGQSIFDGIITGFMQAEATKKAIEPLNKAVSEAMEDGVLSLEEAESIKELGNNARIELVESVRAMGPAFEIIAQSFGLVMDKEAEEAARKAEEQAAQVQSFADSLGAGVASAVSQGYLDGATNEEINLAVRESVFASIFGGIVEAFLQQSLIIPIVLPFAKDVGGIFGQVLAGELSIEVAIGMVRGITESFKVFLESPEFNAILDSIGEIGRTLRESLDISVPEVVTSVRPIVDSARDIVSASRDVCTSKCDLARETISLGEAALDAGGGMGSVTLDRFIPREELNRREEEARKAGALAAWDSWWTENRSGYTRGRRFWAKRDFVSENPQYSLSDLREAELFAQGGLVTSPTLGIVGEAGPELIVPLNNVSRAQSTTGLSQEISGLREDLRNVASALGSQPIDVQLSVDGKQLHTTVDRVDRVSRRVRSSISGGR